MRNIRKTFFGAPVLKGVDFCVHSGEIHALLGENGAGKSTLMNILYGLYKPDDGTITIDGEEVSIEDPRDALSQGIGMVHQHFQLVNTLTVSENITLGLRETGYPFSKRKLIDQRIKELSETFGLDVDPAKLIKGLSVGERQRIEIMKLLYRSAKIFILDEPTAVLSPPEVESFFNVLRELRNAGNGVVIITHKIGEVMQISDRVTVLRDGEGVLQSRLEDTNEHELSKAMIGRTLTQREHEIRSIDVTSPRLVLQDVTIHDGKLSLLQNLSISIAPGEIMGIAGVDGNGQQELAEAIIGIRKLSSGTITFNGNKVDGRSIIDRMNNGMGYIPADRHNDAILLPMNLNQNLLLKKHLDPNYLNHHFLKRKKAESTTKNLIKEFFIKTPSENTAIRYLSGGNQQKFVLARELDSDLQLLIAFQPTRGLDLGATDFIQSQLLDLANRGVSILLISTDLQEIISLSDRIAVLYKGENMGILENDDQLDIALVGAMMGGKRLENQ